MKRPARAVVAVALILIAWPTSNSGRTPAVQAFPAAGDEFVGPFPSWTNVKTAYGAKGDGVSDDTASIQRGLDDLAARAGQSPVLYFPSGRYRLTKTLTLAFRIYVSVVGEDPDTTAVVWDGPPDGTMLLVNGVAYSRLTRLTFDGRRTASVAIEQSWDGTKPHFDTGNEYSDARFLDVQYGIHGGFKDKGFAETSILRSRFVRNTKAGVALGNFNALDIWIWNSLFEDCDVGVTNDPGAGNYHVYDSIFRRSKTADLMMRNTGGFSARDNFSSGSKAFYVGWLMNHPATIDLQHNTVVDAIEPTAIRMGNHGPALLLDNIFASRSQAPGPFVSWRSLLGADVVSIGNTFTVDNALGVSGRLISFDDRTVPRSTLRLQEPEVTGSFPNLGRAIIEVPRGASGPVIQRAIDAAVQQNGQRPIVHLPFGEYQTAQTLTIPPSDLQIVGDGMGTRLNWAGVRGVPLMRITGPTRATLREIQIHANPAVDGVVIDHADQPGSRFSFNGLELRQGEQTNLLVNGMRNAEIQLINVGHASAFRGTSIRVDGGQLTIFSGATSGNRLTYDLGGSAHVLVRDSWYESPDPTSFARVTGRADVTFQGLRVSSAINAEPPAFLLNDLDGRVTVLTTHIDDRIVVSGDGRRAQFLALGLLREPRSASYFSSTNVPPANAFLANGRQRRDSSGPLSLGSVPVADIGVRDPVFIRAMLQETRARITPTLRALPPDATDLRMFRVWITEALNNLVINGEPPR